jgi:hypothetical protein
MSEVTVKVTNHRWAYTILMHWIVVV